MPSALADAVVGVTAMLALAAYEAGWAAARPTPPRWRRWCAWGSAGLLGAALGLPWATGGSVAPVWMVTLQLCLTLFGVTPLAALAEPGRRWEDLRRGRRPAGNPWAQDAPTPWWRRWGPVGMFVAVMLAWRLPGPVDALARVPALVALELASAVAGGWLLWADLVDSRSRPARPNPLMRVVLAAVSAWATWIVAYVLGFSTHSWFGAYAGRHGGLGAASDQEVAVIITFVTAAAAFVPVVFWNLFRWLGADAARPDVFAARYRGGPGPGNAVGPGPW